MEQILVLIYPGTGVLFGIGTIMKEFQKRGGSSVKLKGLKMVNVDDDFAKQHFSHLKEAALESFVEYLTDGPVVAMLFEGEKDIENFRNAVGNVELLVKLPFMHSFLVTREYIYVSDSENAMKDIALWFPPGKQPNRWSGLPRQDSLEYIPEGDFFIATPIEEQTVILINREAVDYIGQIILVFQKKCFFLKGLNLLDNDFDEKLRLCGTPFSGLVGPVVAMVWQGENIVSEVRKTVQVVEEDGTSLCITDSGIEIDRNLIHVSQSVESAEAEIGIWFPHGIVQWPKLLRQSVYES